MDDRAARYLLRLGVDASPPSVEALNHLVRRHLETVPFETLSLHSGERVTLDIDWILEKFLVHGRGGFCYELGGAFAWLLEMLGYDVNRLAAQVYNPEGEIGPPFDHLTLEVMLDQAYLVDVGFGDSPLVALPLCVDAIHSDGQRHYRIRQDAGTYLLERQREGRAETWKPQYRFARTPHHLDDFAAGCAFHQSAESPFAIGPICSILRHGDRVTLQKNKLIHTSLDGTQKETPVADAAEFHRALDAEFGIRLPRAIVLSG